MNGSSEDSINALGWWVCRFFSFHRRSSVKDHGLIQLRHVKLTTLLMEEMIRTGLKDDKSTFTSVRVTG